MNNHTASDNPLGLLEDWEDFVEQRYPAPGEKPREDYRNYDNLARDTVCDFYRLNHRHQTYDFVREKKRAFLRLDRRQMTVLEALDFLDTLVDDSDPDISLSQREHLLQTADTDPQRGRIHFPNPFLGRRGTGLAAVGIHPRDLVPDPDQSHVSGGIGLFLAGQSLAACLSLKDSCRGSSGGWVQRNLP